MAGNDITFNLTFEDVFYDKLPKPKQPVIAAPIRPYIKTHKDIKTHVSGVTNYARVIDFVNAQNNGIITGHLIPNNSVNFDKGDGSTFYNAIEDINKNITKQKHWIWYILPSNISTVSATATFFKLGPETDNTYQITIKEYLDNETLCKNYIQMINTLYDKMDKGDAETMKKSLYDIMYGNPAYGKILHGNNPDYKKLKSSISNFAKPLISKLELFVKNTGVAETTDIASARTNITQLYNIFNPLDAIP